MILLKMVERCVERGLVAVADNLGEQRVELRFPEAILDAAARREERKRQTDQFVGIGGRRLAIRWRILKTYIERGEEPHILVRSLHHKRSRAEAWQIGRIAAFVKS
ncbi:hypothetical protein C7S13_2167 [Burkholderia cepacia]|nr:hypothetical protein [Burkholderia cepacia]